MSSPMNTTTSEIHRGSPRPSDLLPIKPGRNAGLWISIVLGILLIGLVIQFFVFNDNWHWDVVGGWLFSKRVMAGLVNTLILTVLSTVIGLALGIVNAIMRMSGLFVLRSIAAIYVWIIRAAPALVLILFIYFLAALVPNLSLGIPFLPPVAEIPTNHIISQFSAAVIGLSLYLGAYSSEIFRSGVMSVPAGQFEVCHSLGLSTWKSYTKVIGPQIVRVITPTLANEVVTMFKNTALVSVIGYVELLTTVQLVYSQNFQTIPLLTVAMIWYLFLTSIAMIGQSRLEKRFGRGFSRRSSIGSEPIARPVDDDQAESDLQEKQ